MGTTTMQSAAAPNPKSQPAPPSRPMAQASPDHRAPMEMTVAELEAAIAALPGKREALREAFDRLAACSPSPLPFSWEGLDGHVSSLQSSIALRFRQLRVLEAAGAVPASAALGGTRGDGKGEKQEEVEEEVVKVEVEEEEEEEEEADEEIQEADRNKICNDEKDGKETRELEVEEEVVELEKADEDMQEPDSDKICNDEKDGNEAREVEAAEVAELEKKADEEMQEASYDQICNDDKDGKEAREEVAEEGEIEEASSVMIGNEMKDEKEAREEEQAPDKAMQMVDKVEVNTKDAFKADEDRDTNMDKTVAEMASSVQACAKKQKQEQEAQQQDVHDKVEGAQNAMVNAAVVAHEMSSDRGNRVLPCRSDDCNVANEISSHWGNRALPCRSDDCTVACANMDAERLLKLICTITELNSKFLAAFRFAPDAPALVVHVVELFLHNKIFVKTNKVWANCVGLVQLVPAVVTKPSGDTIEQAKRVAKDWKEMIDNPESCKVLGSLPSWGLLYFLVSYNIVTEFDTKEIFRLFGNIPCKQKRKSAMLLTGLGLSNRIPELMDYLIGNRQQLDVFWLAHSFHMVGKYSPLSLLKGYVEQAKQTAMEISQNNMTHQLWGIIRKELHNLRRAHTLANKKGIPNSKLCTSIRKEINIVIGELEKKQNLENPLTTSISNSQQLQTKSKEKLKIGQKQEHHKGQENQMRGQLNEFSEKLEKKQRKTDEEMHEANSNKICNDEKDGKETREVEVEVVSELEKKDDEVMQEADYKDRKEAREEVVEEGEIEEAANVMIGNKMKDEEAREEELDPNKAIQMVDKEELNTKDAFMSSQDTEEDHDTNMDETVAEMAPSVQACAKQEQEAQEQDVHDKVAVVANEMSSDRGNQALPCRSDDCTVACTNMDAERLLKFICTTTELNSKFLAAFRCAPDAAALALHVVELFLHNKIFVKTNKVWANCVGLVQMVPAVVTKPSGDTIEQAKQVAKDWKEMIDNPESCKVLGSLPSWGLLYFLVSYNIVTEFDTKEIFCLFGNIPCKLMRKSAMLLKELGLGDRIPELMDYLIGNRQQLDVFWLAWSFHMVGKYSPLSLLKGYVEQAKQTAMEISQKNMTHQLKGVIRKELHNLRRAHIFANKKEMPNSNLCISIRKEINILIGEFEKKKQNLEYPLTASTSDSHQLQTKSKKQLKIEQKEHHKGQENLMLKKLEMQQRKPQQEQQPKQENRQEEKKQKQEDRQEEKKQKQEDEPEDKKQKQKDEPEEKKRKQEDKLEEKQQQNRQKRQRQHTHQVPTQGYPAMWNSALRGDLEFPPYAAMHGVHLGYPTQPGWPQLGAPEYIGPFTPLYPHLLFYPR